VFLFARFAQNQKFFWGIKRTLSVAASRRSFFSNNIELNQQLTVGLRIVCRVSLRLLLAFLILSLPLISFFHSILFAFYMLFI